MNTIHGFNSRLIISSSGYVLFCVWILLTYQQAEKPAVHRGSAGKDFGPPPVVEEAVVTEQPVMLEEKKTVEKWERWMVVMMTGEPTEALIKLNQLAAFKLLMVGTEDSPVEINLDGAVYLDVNKQRELNYKSQQKLLQAKYSRKNVGYLYAIAHGAKYIYDASDDGLIQNWDAFHFSGSFHGLEAHTSELATNPYAHFGQSSIWPRGFPLEHLGQYPPRKYIVSPSTPPAIQQSMVDGNPDLDAIFRLTRKEFNSEINITFDRGAPNMIIPHGTYAPFNSDNTLFLEDALWASVLPVSVSDKVADVIRSFWAERLLQLVGHQVAFLSSKSIRKGITYHSDLADMTEELDSYFNAGELCHFLSDWTCSGTNFFQCIRDLTIEMVKANFLQQIDFELVDLWLQDLVNFGYTPPKVVNSPKLYLESARMVVYYPHEKPTCMPNTPHLSISDYTAHTDSIFNVINLSCGQHLASKYSSDIHYSSKFEDVLLLIEISELKVIPYLHTFYSFHFSQIAYCGGFHLDDVNLKYPVTYIQQPSSLTCLETAIQMNYKVKAVFLIPDTVSITLNMVEIQEKQDGSQIHLSFNQAIKNSQTPRLEVNEIFLEGMRRGGRMETKLGEQCQKQKPVMHISNNMFPAFLDYLAVCKIGWESCNKELYLRYCNIASNAHSLELSQQVNLQQFYFSNIEKSDKSLKVYCELLDSML